MAAPYKLVEIQYSAETAFAENAESPSSNTWSARIPCLSYNLTLNQDRIRDGSYRSRLNEENLSHPGVRTATLEFTSHFMGHITTAAGALTETWQQDLLSTGLGGGSTAGSGTTISGITSTATTLNVADSSGFAAGQVLRVGSKGDGKGDGQPGVVSSITDGTPDTIVLLTGAPAAPTTASHVVYKTQVAYHDESASLSSVRFLVGHTTTGAQVHLMGGQLAGVSFTLPIGGLPTITYRYEFAYWARAAVTIPSSSPTLSSHDAAPVAGGSVFLNDVGTATRSTVQPSEISVTINLGLEPIVGPGGSGNYQHIVGYVRTACKPEVSMLIPWVTTYETWWDTGNASIAYKHCLIGLNAADGKACGFYLPRALPVGPRPSAVSESNGQDYVRLTLAGVDGATTTNELTRSAIRVWSG